MKLDKTLRNRQGVYRLNIGKHSYIGSSVNLYNRLHSHLWALSVGKHDNQYLQRTVIKYGFDSLHYEILESCFGLTESILRKRELYYIQTLNPDLNLKADPTTERNCITTSKITYQYDREGNLVKEWPSSSEAARFYNVVVSNIDCCCLHPKRQQFCKGFLWARVYPYPYKIPPLIHIFDLDGNKIGTFKDTVEIAERLFSKSSRKTVLSQLKKKIDSTIPYKSYFLTTDPNFVVTEDLYKKYKYKKDSVFKALVNSNPLLYEYDRSNNFIRTIRLNDIPHKGTMISRIRNGKCYKYSFTKRSPNDYCSPVRRHKCWCQNNDTGEVFIYNTRNAAALELFGDIRLAFPIGKHIKRNTSFRGYKFRDL